MGQDIKHFVVAICDDHGEIMGTGFVIAPNVVTTCAHVVSSADVDPGGNIAIKLPDADTFYQAEVLADNYDFANDVAILKCHTALPAKVNSAILGHWQDATHTQFHSYGYRPLDIYTGNPAAGLLLREVSDIKPRLGEPHPTHPVLSLSSQQISPGMSGSPVYVPATDRVVGMITSIWNSAGRDRDTAFAISAEAIVAAWPAVALRSAGEKSVTTQADIKKLIAKHSRRLQLLKEKQAILGINADPGILIEIEDIEAELEKLQAQLKPMEGTSFPTKTIAPEVKGDGAIAGDSGKVSTVFFSLIPSWIEPYPDLRPLSTADDAITTMLKGFSPFPKGRAEIELPFLFGNTGGFWSGHSLYAEITSNPVVQVVLADAGAGKTALAYALRQVGTPEGNPLPQTLPVVMKEHTPLSLTSAKTEVIGAILQLLRHNPALLARLSIEEKKSVVRFVVNQFGPADVTHQLQAAAQQDHSLRGLINQFDQLKQSSVSVTWLRTAQSVLKILGFRQVALAIDANRRPAGQINTWLKHMHKWGEGGINPILFLPLDRQHEFESLLIANIRVLTWTERQLAAMATWRFERLVNRIGVHLSLTELFEGELMNDWVRLSNRSPRRLARLWELMAQHHAENGRESRVFTWDDLAWAFEQAGK